LAPGRERQWLYTPVARIVVRPWNAAVVAALGQVAPDLAAASKAGTGIGSVAIACNEDKGVLPVAFGRGEDLPYPDGLKRRACRRCEPSPGALQFSPRVRFDVFVLPVVHRQRLQEITSNLLASLPRGGTGADFDRHALPVAGVLLARVRGEAKPWPAEHVPRHR
jgi:hypothetical protein